MKVMIPVEDNQQKVCIVFGRAPFFLLADTETGSRTFVTNPGADAPGGAGLQSAQEIVDQGADVLLTVRCGENAATVLQAAEIAIHQATEGDAESVLTAYLEGKLPVLDHFHAGFHGKQ